MFCSKCGTKVEAGWKACPSCGTAVGAEAAPAAQATATAPTQQAAPVFFEQAKPIQSNTKFIFVVSVVFLIFFAIRTFLGVSTIGSWGKQKSGSAPEGFNDLMTRMDTATLINFVLAVAIFVILIICVVQSSNLKKNPAEQGNAGIAKKLKILFIVAVCLTVAYFVSEMVFSGQMGELIEMARASGNFTDVEMIALETEMSGTVVGAIIFDSLFVVFGVLSLMKSSKLEHEFANKEQTAGDPQNVSQIS